MKVFDIKEEDLQIIYERGEKKAVIIKYSTFIKILQKLRGKKRREESDLLSQVIGICEGPPDLAERHDKYIYGDK